MPIRFRCSRCDHVMEAPTASAGEPVRCARCLEDLTVPVPKPAPAPGLRPDRPGPATGTIRVRCRHCGHVNEGPATAAGRAARCLQCAAPFVVPGGPARRPAAPQPLDLVELEEGEPVADPRPAPRAASGRTRPGAAAAWWESARDLRIDPGAAWVAAMASVVVLAPTAMAFGPAVLPHGLIRAICWLLVGLGFAMGVGGYLWLIVTPFREGVACGLLTTFLFPFYTIYYTLTRWGATYRPFLTMILGTVLLIASLFFAAVQREPGESIPFLADFRREPDAVGVLPPFRSGPERAAEERRKFEENLGSERGRIARRLDAVRRSLAERYGEGRSATVTVEGVDDWNTFDRVRAALKGKAGDGPDDFFATMDRAGRMVVVLGPVADADALAGAVDFGRATVSGRVPIEIAVEFGRAQSAEEPPPVAARSSPPAPPARSRRPEPPVAAGPAPPAVDPDADRLAAAAGGVIRSPVHRVGTEVVFPAGAADFVAIGNETLRETWDLRSCTRVGVQRQVRLQPPMALSPDGKALAGTDQGRRGALTVYSTLDGAPLLDLGAAAVSSPDYLEFAGPDRLVSLAQQSLTLRVWEVPSGRVALETRLPFRVDGRNLQVDPAGRRLAVVEWAKPRLAIIDLDTGKVTRSATLVLPGGGPSMTVSGLAFAPDGSELVALVEMLLEGRAWIATWKGTSARVVPACSMRDGSNRAWSKKMFYPGPPIENLREGGGWLIQGSVVVRRRECRPIPFSLAPVEEHMLPRRSLPGGRLAVVEGTGFFPEAVRLVPRPN